MLKENRDGSSQSLKPNNFRLSLIGCCRMISEFGTRGGGVPASMLAPKGGIVVRCTYARLVKTTVEIFSTWKLKRAKSSHGPEHNDIE